PAAELTPEQEAERAAEAEAAEARRERNNRLQDEWTAAREVRRTWLAGLVGSKTLPKDAARWTASVLIARVRDYYYDQGVCATDLLDVPDDADPAEWASKRPGKAQHVAFAFALAKVESNLGRYGWNMADSAAPYLNQLVAWGYTLSHVEQIVTGAASADEDPAADDAAEATENADQDAEADTATE
ncbi:hypothetical protein QF011_003675, partial [Curtobacterium flaccumfaciens]|nr:hypothetical protein [Curtobacterium flaccumfaciens]